MRSLRLIYIGFVLCRYRVDSIIFRLPWLASVRWLGFFNPFRYIRCRKLSRGESIRLAFEKLGPIFIKFGQVISTRRDFLPVDISDELAKLQDKAPPFSSKKAREVVEKSLGMPIEKLFYSFEDTALASASIAQVHAAILMTGEEVVVKVLRPNAIKQIHKDLRLIKTLAKWLQKFLKEGARVKPVELVEEFKHGLLNELDFYQEAGNAGQFREYAKNSSICYIPNIHWKYCGKHVLVMERVYGVSVANIEALKSRAVNLPYLAKSVIEMFFTQVFYDNFFHGDLHPGNIFINVDNVEKPYFSLVDFGVVGTLTLSDRQYIAENLLAFFNRDYFRIAELHLASGWLPKNTRAVEFASTLRAMCEPFFEKPLREISIGILLLRLFQAARQFHVNIQPQLILLQKNLLYVEGMGRQLDPDLDLWLTAKPFLESWLKKQIGPMAMLCRLFRQLPAEWLKFFVH